LAGVAAGGATSVFAKGFAAAGVGAAGAGTGARTTAGGGFGEVIGVSGSVRLC
jgi:hypothetical protein